MIHYSCDRCKREIDTEHDMRYIVRLEIEAAIDHLSGETVDDPDHLGALEDLLESSDDYSGSALGEELSQRKRYDLCGECYRSFMKNPLGKESSIPFGFSKN